MTAADHLRIAISALERADAALGVVVEQRGEISVRGPAAIARGDVKALTGRLRLIANFEAMR